MKVMVKDLTVEELSRLIFEAGAKALEELVEDIVALSSDEYLQSIKEARADYKEGRVKRLEDITDVQDNAHREGSQGLGEAQQGDT